ncbi:MAG: Eukaryotic translation initiation factor 6 [Chaenotheca gracillima]|nr:MAG: Eukaryotic translation initiation factor 6 [Chaenotheca gracillima]
MPRKKRAVRATSKVRDGLETALDSESNPEEESSHQPTRAVGTATRPQRKVTGTISKRSPTRSASRTPAVMGPLPKTKHLLPNSGESEYDGRHVDKKPRLSSLDRASRVPRSTSAVKAPLESATGTRAGSVASSNGSGSLDAQGRKRSRDEAENDLQDEPVISSGAESDESEQSDHETLKLPLPKRRRREEGSEFASTPAVIDTDSGLNETPALPVKRGRGRPRIQKSPASSMGPVKPASRLPGRRRKVIDPRIEEDLQRQAELRKKYRSVVKLLKPVLVELAERTVSELKQDPEAHKQSSMYEVVMEDLSRRLNQNIAGQERELQFTRKEKLAMFEAQKHIIKRNFERKCNESKEKMLLQCKDEFIRISKRLEADGDEEATEDEGGYPARRKRKGTWMDPDTGLSRSGFYVQVERNWLDFAAESKARHEMEKTLKSTAPEAVVEQPLGFVVADQVQKEGALASLGFDTLMRAAEAMDSVQKVEHSKPVPNSQALGLQMLASAIEQGPTAPATSGLRAVTPQRSPPQVDGAGDLLIQPMSTPKVSKPNPVAKSATKRKPRRKAAGKEIEVKETAPITQNVQFKPPRSSGSSFFSNILNAEESSPVRPGTKDEAISDDRPRRTSQASIAGSPTMRSMAPEMVSVGEPLPGSARGLPAIAAKPAGAPRYQESESAPVTPQLSHHQTAPVSGPSPAVWRNESSVPQNPPAMFSPSAANYHRRVTSQNMQPPGTPTYSYHADARTAAERDQRSLAPGSPLEGRFPQSHPSAAPVPPSIQYAPQYSRDPHYPPPQPMHYPPPPPHTVHEHPQHYQPQYAQRPERESAPERNNDTQSPYQYYHDGRPVGPHPHQPYPIQLERSQGLPPPPYSNSYYQYPPQAAHPYPPQPSYPPPPPGPPPLSSAQMSSPSLTTPHHSHAPQTQPPPYGPQGHHPAAYPPNQHPQPLHPMQGPMYMPIPPAQPQQVPYGRYQPTGPPEQHPALRPNFPAPHPHQRRDHW